MANQMSLGARCSCHRVIGALQYSDYFIAPNQNQGYMHSLQELVDVVSRNKVKSIRTLEPRRGEQPDMLHDFYERLCRQEFADDDAAAAHYGYPSARSRAYRKQRQKLEERLHNSLFFIDVTNPMFGDAQKAFYQCHKEYVIMLLLAGRNAVKAAVDQAERTLRTVDKYEFTDLGVLLLLDIIRYHALYTGNKRKCEACQKRLHELRRIQKLEQKAQEFYYDIHVEYKKKLHLSKKTLLKAQKYVDILEGHSQEVMTYRFHLMRFGLVNIVESLTNNMEALIENCDHAIAFFNQKLFVSQHFVAGYSITKLMAYTKARDIKMGTRMFNQCLRILEPGTLRWFKVHELYFLLLMHVKNYNQAIQVVQTAKSSENFNKQSEHTLEWWKLFDAYLCYLEAQCSISGSHESNSGGFNVKHFLKEMPRFSLDKRGYNVPVLIIQILFLIHEKSYDKLASRLDAIEKYSTRYLKKGSSFRSNCFIKMLLQLPKQNYHRDAVVRHTSKYLSRLTTDHNLVSSSALELEIIPYEHLWEYVLESLPD